MQHKNLSTYVPMSGIPNPISFKILKKHKEFLEISALYESYSGRNKTFAQVLI